MRSLLCLIALTTTWSVPAPRGPATVYRQVAVPSYSKPAKGRFLIATRNLVEPTFARTVILLIEYGDEGAMGVVINRETEIPLAQVLPDLPGVQKRNDRIFWGGPVSMNLVVTLIRAAKPPEQSQAVFADVYATGSRSVVTRALSAKGKGNRIRVFAGHAGWAPGQLDGEITRGDWQVVSADVASIFDTAPGRIWEKLSDAHSGDWTMAPLPPIQYARGDPLIP